MARQILRLLGTRYGVALVLIVVVVAAVGVARSVGGGSRPGSTTVAPRTSAASTAPSADSSLGDDSVATSEGPATPRTAPGAPGPGDVAMSFAKAWLRPNGVSPQQWLSGMRPYATKTLIDRLAGADPATVPADAVRGELQTRVRDSELVEVSIPVNPGLLRLRVIFTEARWLVDSVAWDRP